MNKCFLSFFILFIWSLIFVSHTQAAYFYNSPSKIVLNVGEKSSFDIWIDTEGENIFGYDAYVNYDPSEIRVDSIIPSPELKGIMGTHIDLSPRYASFIMSGYVIVSPNDGSYTKVNGKHLLATVNITSLKPILASMNFDCTPHTTTDSNIARDGVGGVDIIDCAKNQNIDVDIYVPNTPSPCLDKIKSGDYNCDDKVTLADFEKWRSDFIAGKASLKDFEHFRAAFTESMPTPNIL